MKRVDIRGLAWADIKSNESKKMPQAHDGVASARSFLRELRRVAGLLPSRQSSIDNIVAELLAIGGRYHRNLHQDEFGPTRAERMQALRDLLVRLGVLSSRLEALPPQLRLLLSEGFLECRSAAGQLDVDPVASYSADKTAVEVVSETASDVRHTLASVGRTEANLIGEVCAAADAIVLLLWNLDTTTDGDVVIDAGSASGLIHSDDSQIGRSSSHYESRNCRQRHARRSPPA